MSENVKVIKLVIKIGDDEIQLDMRQARGLYEELKALFEPKPAMVWRPENNYRRTERDEDNQIAVRYVSEAEV